MSNLRSGRRASGMSHILILHARLRAWLFTCLIRRSFRRFGSGSRVIPPFRFTGLEDVEIGSDVTINRDGWICTTGAPTPDGSPKLRIGARASIGMGVSIAAAQRVELGERVLLARNVYISDHGHAYQDVTRPVADQGISPPRPVRIGNGVWIGQNACILPGVTIGHHAVIGANAVVSHDVPADCVAAGVPARVIRHHDAATGTWRKGEPTETPKDH